MTFRPMTLRTIRRHKTVQTRRLQGTALARHIAEIAGPTEAGRAVAARLSAALTEARFRATTGRVPLRASSATVAGPAPGRSRFLGGAPATVVAAVAPVPRAPAPTPNMPAEKPVAAAKPAAAPAPPAPATTQAKPFDPYAFSVVAMLRKSGRDAVVERLAALNDTGDLRRLAEVQHLALPAGLTSAADIRAAIIASGERRIADRRAAAG